MSGPLEEQETSYIEVTNGLTEEIVMSFHGEPYAWAAGESVVCTVEAAKHIFGFGEVDKAPAMLRLGWCNTAPECTMKHALAKLKDIKFRPVQHVFDMPQGDARTRRGKKASASDRSLASQADSTGEVASAGASPAAPKDVAVGDEEF